MLHYQTIECPGSEEWIVLVHGAGGSSGVWFRQVHRLSQTHNILLLDLRGHGQSAKTDNSKVEKKNYTFNELAYDVIEVLDHLNLRGCHFIALSIGTIIIREIAQIDPTYIKSMVMAGAILKLSIRTRLLSRSMDIVKMFIPYKMLYKIYAYIIMPRSAHKKSRALFIENAMKIANNEFCNFLTLNRGLNNLLNSYCSKEPEIPTLYIMGENDYVFMLQVRMYLLSKNRYSMLHIIPKAGHVCNIDSYASFNDICCSFYKNIDDIRVARQNQYVPRDESK